MVVLLIITFFLTSLYAESGGSEKPRWRLSTDAMAAFAFNSYNESWDSMESGSLLWNARSTTSAKKQLREGLYNENTLKLAFGQIKFADRESKKWSPPEKSTDLIDLETLLKLKMKSLSADPFLSLRAVSQFYDTRDPDNYRYANPLTLTNSFGAAKYLFRQPDISWQMRLGGALRLNIDRDTVPYKYIDGLRESGRRETSVITDAGLELITEFKIKRSDAAHITGKLTVFEALARPYHLQTHGWRRPDVSFETAVNVNITKRLIVNYMAELIYDREIDSAPGIRQTLSAGLSLSFENEHLKKRRQK
ncbi:MAG: hypothetical protein LBB56_00055 [Chitinispirillales bacterium]|jgi:hypothetical protein|nr:hypothetical protein [Chitinispirillales bacterium]